MIRNKGETPRFTFSLFLALAIHLVLLFIVKKESLESQIFSLMNEKKSLPLKIDSIKIIKPEEVEKIRQVGIKNGSRDILRPDLPKPQRPLPSATGKKGTPKLSLDNLGPQLKKPSSKNQALPVTPPQPATREKVSSSTTTSEGSHFYFNPKKEKIIPRSSEQEQLKKEAGQNFGPSNKATEHISNFEIRYERPEGVSEDELNSDEKAYYSFYVRSYKNYFSKIYSNYEKIVVQRPGLANVFDRKHLLIGKIDYDEKGNIVTVRILKSSENDDLHYFFEETLKELNQPNPPKVFTKNRKQFSIYYQIQIN